MNRRPAIAALGLLLGALACGSPEPAPQPADTRVENAALDLALASVPDGLQVQSNDDNGLVLASADGGIVHVTADPASDFGIDVVALANSQKDDFLARPNGEFSGARQLSGPLGQSTYARGRFDDEAGKRVEETRIFAVHPTANRLVRIVSRYPAGDDSAARVQQVMAVLGELEARTPDAPAQP